MTFFIKDPHKTIFTGPMGYEKSKFVLDMIEKGYNKHLDYIIIIFSTLRWNKKYHARG